MESDRFLLPSLVLAAATLASCASDGDAQAGRTVPLAGVVFLREPVAVPYGSTVSVRLAERSSGDAPETVLAATSFLAEGAPPYRYFLDVPAGAVRPGGRYVVAAQIDAEGSPRYRGSVQYPDDPAAQPASVDVLVVGVR